MTICRPSLVASTQKMTCPTRKVCYPDRKAANLQMLYIWKSRKRAQRCERRAYECPRCGNWHLTSRND